MNGPIHDPKPALTKLDKEIIEILSNALLHSLAEYGEYDFLSPAPLSNEEALRLASQLERLLEDPKFYKSIQFEKMIRNMNDKNIEIARELYLSERKKRGRTRALASTHWASFCIRVGRGIRTYPAANTSPMTLDHFLKMEERLFKSLKLNPQIISVLISLIKAVSRHEDSPYFGERASSTSTYDIFRAIDGIKRDLEEARKKNTLATTRQKLFALIVLISNSAVMFTTRDWSATGTISTYCGSAVLVMPE